MPLAYHNTVTTWNLHILVYIHNLSKTFPPLDTSESQNKTIYNSEKFIQTNEGTKGAMIPPTRENMEQAPIPTFLRRKKMINQWHLHRRNYDLKSANKQGKNTPLIHDPDHIKQKREVKYNWKHPKTGIKTYTLCLKRSKNPLHIHNSNIYTHIERQRKCNFS